ncbi:MAG: hypothetical protein UR66_C0005G0019 [Candidatus Moranbacteria bacterium GW2011_GWE1_35_17]|nr:MAG: hypothetical protein UR66_C0005G0019 [Candidatus Moranbacteria bacterium GW2011_GWE1_35_17]
MHNLLYNIIKSNTIQHINALKKQKNALFKAFFDDLLRQAVALAKDAREKVYAEPVRLWRKL